MGSQPSVSLAWPAVAAPCKTSTTRDCWERPPPSPHFQGHKAKSSNPIRTTSQLPPIQMDTKAYPFGSAFSFSLDGDKSPPFVSLKNRKDVILNQAESPVRACPELAEGRPLSSPPTECVLSVHVAFDLALIYPLSNRDSLQRMQYNGFRSNRGLFRDRS
jgi:hypothetical protein